ncbi:MAG: OsmC family protein [Candidatus Eiseniibacteriota bacterium]
MERKAEARWTGDLKSGKGHLKLGSGAHHGSYTYLSRFEDESEMNPEELLGAAHAACYSMALAHALAQAGHPAKSVDTTATVHLSKVGGGFSISGIDLVTRGIVPGIAAPEFLKLAEETKTGCIVSRALSAVPMTLDAQLLPG